MLGSSLRNRGVEIDLFDAVGLAASLHDGQDFEVPVIIARDGGPVFAELSLGLQIVRSGMQNHVVAAGYLQKAAKGAAQQGGQLATVFPGQERLKLVIMRSRNQPGFVGDAGSVRAKSVVIPDVVHDSGLLADFLAKDVAENAALA